MNDVIIQKIELILGNAFNINNYVELISEIFPSFQTVAPYRINKEYSNFSSHIEGYAHVGTFQTPDKKKIIIMAVQLKKAGYVENSRSTHRSFAKKLIENGNADAAFIAFYTEDDPKWRLSLVRLDYEMKIENGRLKTAENLTPAKRYSYLVGKNEPCHTSIKQFHRFITDSTAHPEYPTLDALENAFSVEKVTNEFFNLYCEKFHQLREQLETIEDFRIEAEQHNFTSAQFAKKLMGQIVFLYFLQKKGWLGVKAWPETLNEKEYKNAFFARGAKSRELIPIVYRPVGDGTYKISSAGLDSISDADEEVLAQCVKGKPWGSGPHDFMRKLFEHAIKKKINFFNELLEPLFYDALNRNRGEQGYCPALHCRIPFLSGGLFEPIDGYDWEHNDFSIPNEVFSNAAEKGRDADGILDIFDRYNFTMSEDEPMEREVAIDPEMLGKVFENLLEINDRKSKGAFYTPREIVHYMCQESLINYLANALSISEEAIRDFILYGDFMKDEDTIKEKRQGNGGMYISEELYKINPDGTVAVNRLLDMDKALKDVRIADPAVGSGAFPLGMLNEIVRARQNISAYLAITKSNKDKHWMYQMERSPHTLKYETIRNCIFACDIEPSAVDIAQLRLWLALVIDDEINPNAQTPLDGHRNPLPLPNLESNILCGNSLIDEFEGVRLIKESDLLGSTSTYQLDFTSSRFDSIVKQLIEKQDALFRCDDTNKKRKLTDEIKALRNMIIMNQLEYAPADMKERFYGSQKMASKPYVLWQLDFARVFREKGGFDIVIGNPPYVGEKGNKELFRPIAATDFGRKYYYGKMDLFYFFFHKGLDIGNEKAEVSFITTNYYPTAFGGKILRKDFMERSQIRRMINFNELKIFESALGQHNMITMLTKIKESIYARNCFCKVSGVADAALLKRILYAGITDNDYFIHKFVEQKALYDGDEMYIRIMGVGDASGDSIDSVLNKIASSGKTLKEIADIKQGIVSGADKYTDAHEAKYGLGIAKGTGIFVIKKEELALLNLSELEHANYVKATYKNHEIRKYKIDYENNLFVFYLTDYTPPSDVPNILAYLEQFKPLLEKRLITYGESYPWYSLHRARNEAVLGSSEKIVNSRRAKSNIFALGSGDYFEQSDLMVTVVKNNFIKCFPTKYILALLNSKLYYLWLKNRGKIKGDMLEMYGKPLEEIPIKEPSKDTVQQIIPLVDAILLGDADNADILSQIDDIIYDIYGLTRQEIQLVKDYR